MCPRPPRRGRRPRRPRFPTPTSRRPKRRTKRNPELVGGPDPEADRGGRARLAPRGGRLDPRRARPGQRPRGLARGSRGPGDGRRPCRREKDPDPRGSAIVRAPEQAAGIRDHDRRPRGPPHGARSAAARARPRSQAGRPARRADGRTPPPDRRRRRRPARDRPIDPMPQGIPREGLGRSDGNPARKAPARDLPGRPPDAAGRDRPGLHDGAGRRGKLLAQGRAHGGEEPADPEDVRGDRPPGLEAEARRDRSDPGRRSSLRGVAPPFPRGSRAAPEARESRASLTPPPIVAIDGPSGAGKSTVAKALAARLHVPYIDTGAMYRAIGLAARERGITLPLAKVDADRVAALAESLSLDLDVTGGQTRVRLNGRDITDAIRLPEISLYASAVSAIPAVRRRPVAEQRRLAGRAGGVLEGRDIGTRVFPDTPHKFFLTAPLDVRAERRSRELAARGTPQPEEVVRAEIERRDHDDSTRSDSPLTFDESYTLIDTGRRSVNEIADELEGRVRQSSGGAMGRGQVKT